MTQDLTLALTAGAETEASSNGSATSVNFTPTSCSADDACPINSNTRADYNTYYYTWYAATAGTGTASQLNTDASASICPVGWRLPPNYTISTAKSYGALTNTYGMTRNGENNNENHGAELDSYPFNFVRSGSYRSGQPYYRDIIANYWSSTASTGAAYAYNFIYRRDIGVTYPQHINSNYGGKSYGFNIRCVAL